MRHKLDNFCLEDNSLSHLKGEEIQALESRWAGTLSGSHTARRMREGDLSCLCFYYCKWHYIIWLCVHESHWLFILYLDTSLISFTVWISFIIKVLGFLLSFAMRASHISSFPILMNLNHFLLSNCTSPNLQHNVK